jgi:hypothetical protein
MSYTKRASPKKTRKYIQKKKKRKIFLSIFLLTIVFLSIIASLIFVVLARP